MFVTIDNELLLLATFNSDDGWIQTCIYLIISRCSNIARSLLFVFVLLYVFCNADCACDLIATLAVNLNQFCVMYINTHTYIVHTFIRSDPPIHFVSNFMFVLLFKHTTETYTPKDFLLFPPVFFNAKNKMFFVCRFLLCKCFMQISIHMLLLFISFCSTRIVPFNFSFNFFDYFLHKICTYLRVESRKYTAKRFFRCQIFFWVKFLFLLGFYQTNTRCGSSGIYAKTVYLYEKYSIQTSKAHTQMQERRTTHRHTKHEYLNNCMLI